MDKKAYALARKYTDDSLDGAGAVKGAPCTIKSITKSDGVNDVEFEWTSNSGTKTTQHMLVSDGEDGINGIDGKDGKDGINGTNGVDGKDGKDGIDGKDGFSPIATVEEESDGATITITDSTGTTSAFVPSGGSGGTSDYNKLHNLPTINGNEAKGELSNDIAAIIDPLSNEDVEDIKHVIDDDTTN